MALTLKTTKNQAGVMLEWEVFLQSHSVSVWLFLVLSCLAKPNEDPDHNGI